MVQRTKIKKEKSPPILPNHKFVENTKSTHKTISKFIHWKVQRKNQWKEKEKKSLELRQPCQHLHRYKSNSSIKHVRKLLMHNCVKTIRAPLKFTLLLRAGTKRRGGGGEREANKLAV